MLSRPKILFLKKLQYPLWTPPLSHTSSQADALDKNDLSLPPEVGLYMASVNQFIPYISATVTGRGNPTKANEA